MRPSSQLGFAKKPPTSPRRLLSPFLKESPAYTFFMPDYTREPVPAAHESFGSGFRLVFVTDDRNSFNACSDLGPNSTAHAFLDE